MSELTCEELEEALRAVDSIIHKCEKAREKFPEGSAHHTLLKRRLRAMVISRTLIERERASMNPENTPTLRTRRLILRRFTPDDVPALLAIHSDGEVNRFLPWFPLKTMEQAEAFYRERYAAAYQNPKGYAYAICLKEDGIPIGYVGIGMDEAHDLGYGLRKEFWHRGIVFEAAQAVIERARADKLPFVTATHDVNNPRSGAVMRKLGMKYCYSYEERWMPKDFPVVFRMYQMNLDGREDRVYRGYWEKRERHFVEDNLK